MVGEGRNTRIVAADRPVSFYCSSNTRPTTTCTLPHPTPPHTYGRQTLRLCTAIDRSGDQDVTSASRRPTYGQTAAAGSRCRRYSRRRCCCFCCRCYCLLLLAADAPRPTSPCPYTVPGGRLHL